MAATFTVHVKSLRKVALQNVKNPERWLQVEDDKLSGNVREAFLYCLVRIMVTHTYRTYIYQSSYNYGVQQLYRCMCSIIPTQGTGDEHCHFNLSEHGMLTNTASVMPSNVQCMVLCTKETISIHVMLSKPTHSFPPSDSTMIVVSGGCVVFEPALAPDTHIGVRENGDVKKPSHTGTRKHARFTPLMKVQYFLSWLITNYTSD